MHDCNTEKEHQGILITSTVQLLLSLLLSLLERGEALIVLPRLSTVDGIRKRIKKRTNTFIINF